MSLQMDGREVDYTAGGIWKLPMDIVVLFFHCKKMVTIGIYGNRHKFFTIPALLHERGNRYSYRYSSFLICPSGLVNINQWVEWVNSTTELSPLPAWKLQYFLHRPILRMLPKAKRKRRLQMCALASHFRTIMTASKLLYTQKQWELITLMLQSNNCVQHSVFSSLDLQGLTHLMISGVLWLLIVYCNNITNFTISHIPSVLLCINCKTSKLQFFPHRTCFTVSQDLSF